MSGFTQTYVLEDGTLTMSSDDLAPHVVSLSGDVSIAFTDHWSGPGGDAAIHPGWLLYQGAANRSGYYSGSEATPEINEGNARLTIHSPPFEPASAGEYGYYVTLDSHGDTDYGLPSYILVSTFGLEGITGTQGSTGLSFDDKGVVGFSAATATYVRDIYADRIALPEPSPVLLLLFAAMIVFLRRRSLLPGG